MQALVIQSHGDSVADWIGSCTASVRRWAELQGYGYRFLGDELFDGLPDAYVRKVAARKPILADLGRLLRMQEALDEGFEAVVWADADLLIWAPERLGPVVVEDALFGRECWVQPDRRGRLKVHRSLHNAFCGFARGSVVLPFLTRATSNIIASAAAERISPQMVGPKLVTALHSIAGFEVTDAVGALSPSVIEDLLGGGGLALDRLRSECGNVLAGANLCASLVGEKPLAELCQTLLLRGCISA